MVRVGGLSDAIDPNERKGQRIQDLQQRGPKLDAGKTCKVNVEGEPVWEVVSRWLKGQKELVARGSNAPRLTGPGSNEGMR